MRHLGFVEYTEVAADVLVTDVQTVKEMFLEPTAAILALRSGGGAPVHEDAITDCAAGMLRLLVNLGRLSPIRQTYGNNRVTAAAVRRYAANRGWHLDYADGKLLELIKYTNHETIDTTSIVRSLGSRLSPITIASELHRSQPALAGVQVTVCTAVTDPTPSLSKFAGHLWHAVNAGATAMGFEVVGPEPRHRRGADGPVWEVPGARPAQPVTTARLMADSIDRVTSGDVTIVIDDPRSTGIHVEREWSLRLQVPVYEVRTSPEIHPHVDAPLRVHIVPAQVDDPDSAAQRLLDLMQERSWEILDARAFREALEYRNRQYLLYLRAAWGAKDSEERGQISDLLGMSIAYIEGILASRRGLELASDFQLRSLELELQSPNLRQRAAPPAPNDHEVELLSRAGNHLGLEGTNLVRSFLMAMTERRTARASTAQLTSDQALRLMRNASERL